MGRAEAVEADRYSEVDLGPRCSKDHTIRPIQRCVEYAAEQDVTVCYAAWATTAESVCTGSTARSVGAITRPYSVEDILQGTATPPLSYFIGDTSPAGVKDVGGGPLDSHSVSGPGSAGESGQHFVRLN